MLIQRLIDKPDFDLFLTHVSVPIIPHYQYKIAYLLIIKCENTWKIILIKKILAPLKFRNCKQLWILEPDLYGSTNYIVT